VTSYRYKRDAYAELTVITTASGGLQVIVTKDRGDRNESIIIPASDVAAVVAGIAKCAAADGAKS
jgi:hypothetical protein